MAPFLLQWDGRSRYVSTASYRCERRHRLCMQIKRRRNKMTAVRTPPQPVPTDETIMTILYTDPLFLKHETGPRHPETAARLRSVTARLEKAGLVKKCVAGTY